ncbi:hypothetical protein [Haladaptatus halobius]|uniref:hypothetical protein n=1 Tax=Haladaptatus halobius TaxID=2884875 RepID=UPI001D0AA52B|nr:hypothetical protein [Haladaptatus halobius]
MKGPHAFCPKTGAPLTEEKHYDERGRSQRVPLQDRSQTEDSSNGELTNGSLRSSKRALLNYFRRCHKYHHEPDQRLYRKAAVGLSRLKRAANGKNEWDIYIWFALGEWLAREGFETKWMKAHTELRCPHCAGNLKYMEFHGGEIIAKCGTNCTDDRADRLNYIREIILELYLDAFKAQDSGDLLLL